MRRLAARSPFRPSTATLALLLLLLYMGATLAACDSRSELLGVVAPATDAGADAAPVLAPPRFAAPTLVTALSDPNAIDEDPTLPADGLEIFFMSNRAGTKDLWTSRRATTTATWAAPTVVTELSSTANDWAPAISLDGLSLWFTTDRDAGRGKIWHTTRADRASPWSTPAAVAELSGDAVDFAPVVDATETLLYFASNRAGSAGYDIYAAARASAAAPWGAPALVPGLASAADEYDPFIAQGGLVVFFTSMRAGAGDIYWSSRRSLEQPFDPPQSLPDIDSDAYDSDSSLSADLATMMFSSTRSGNAELYETRALK